MIEVAREEFAERLQELRIEKGLTLTSLAMKNGVSGVTVGRWERKIRIPNIDSLIALAKFFRVTADYLLGLEN